jgi:energy-coupling factor transporter ATP-binding protein EcfA2
MILRRLHATGFGSLAGEVRFDDTRINLIVGPNESGKSTLAAAIAAALYGLEEDRRGYRGRFTPREQYKPWDGKTYAVELVFDVGGKRYTVNRNFERDTVSVYAEGEGEVSEEFRTGPNEYSVGEFLLGVNVDQFARSALWLQLGPGRLAGPEVRPDESLSSMLERQASSVSGDASAQTALNVLDAALRHYAVGDTRVLVTTQIRRLQGSLDELRQSLAEEEGRIDRAGMALAELKRARELEHELEDERRRSVSVVTRRASAEKAALLERDDEARASVKKLRVERDELAKIPAIEQDAADRLRRAQAELDTAHRSFDEIERRKSESYDQPRAKLEAAIEAQRAYGWSAPVHLEELDEIARERKRIADGRKQADAKRAEVEDELRRAGISVERLEEQRERFAPLEVPDTKLLTHYPASAQAATTAREEAEITAADALSTMETIGRERMKQRILGGGLVAIGLIAAAISVWLAIQGDINPSFIGLAITLLTLGGGAMFLFRGASLRADERSTALRLLTESRMRLQEIKEQSAERELALTDLTRRLALSSNAELLREHAEYLRMVREGDRFAWVHQDLTRLTADEEELRTRCWQWAVRAGAAEERPEPPENWTIDAALTEMREGINNMIALRSQLERLEEQGRHFVEQEKSAKVREEKAIAMARIVVRDLGTPAGDWEKALEELERRRHAHERRHRAGDGTARG